MSDALFRGVDCLGVEVDHLDRALLGHTLLWRSETSAGLAFRDCAVPELVLHTEPWGNRLVLLDSSKGALQTDAEGNVTGVG